MGGKDLWKYCTQEQVRAALRSLRLLDGVRIQEENYFSCLYAVSNHPEQHYHPASVPKKGGGVRRLLVPDPLLCRIQKNILRHVLAELPISEYAAAYKPGTSIVENAKPHVGAKELLKLDIRHFFDSITFFQVYGQAFPSTCYPPAIRTMLANLCCCRDLLPQGAPTSPAVSNLVMKPFDEYMGNWCQERGIGYTRYCDDMAFSGEFDRREVQNKVRSFLAAYGFELNEQKTRVQKAHQRQTVTGIVVNEKPQVSRAYRRKLRAEVHYCSKYGVESHLQRRREGQAPENGRLMEAGKPEEMLPQETGKPEKMPSQEADSSASGCSEEMDVDCVHFLQQLLGKINYVLQVNPEDTEFCRAKEIVKEMLAERASL